MLLLPPVCWSGRTRQPTAAAARQQRRPQLLPAAEARNARAASAATQRRAGEREAAQRGSTGRRTARQQRHAAATQQQADRREQRQHREPHGNGSSDTPQLRNSRRTAESSGSTGSRTATAATCFRRLLLCFLFLERVCGGPLLSLPGLLSLCAGGQARGTDTAHHTRRTVGRAQGDGQEHRWQP